MKCSSFFTKINNWGRGQDHKHIAVVSPTSAHKFNEDVELVQNVQLPHDHI